MFNYFTSLLSYSPFPPTRLHIGMNRVILIWRAIISFHCSKEKPECFFSLSYLWNMLILYLTCASTKLKKTWFYLLLFEEPAEPPAELFWNLKACVENLADYVDTKTLANGNQVSCTRRDKADYSPGFTSYRMRRWSTTKRKSISTL